jgi:hypothetical protein
MGHVIAFPVAPMPYAYLAADLDTAEGVLLVAIRWWVRSHWVGDDPQPRLCQDREAAGAPDASGQVDSLMVTVARAATRPIEMNCRCRHLTIDEQQLLRVARLVQAAQNELAEKVLRTTLLSADGAALATDTLWDLRALFVRARLFLSRRRARPSEDARCSGPCEDTGCLRPAGDAGGNARGSCRAIALGVLVDGRSVELNRWTGCLP